MLSSGQNIPTVQLFYYSEKRERPREAYSVACMVKTAASFY